jgi:hypothetical protein
MHGRAFWRDGYHGWLGAVQRLITKRDICTNEYSTYCFKICHDILDVE